MSDLLFIDDETRSDVDLKTCGAHVYFESPNTDVLIVRYAINDGPIGKWLRGMSCPPEVRAHIEAGERVSGWNVFGFERLAFDAVLGPRYGWPVPKLEQYDDTMHAAAAMALPRSLGAAAEVLDLPIKKDKEGMRLIRKFSMPRKPRKDEPPGLYWNEPEDYPEDFARFVDYCGDDVGVERWAKHRLVPLSDFERRVAVLDAKINTSGVRIDIRSARAALVIADKAKRIMDQEMRAITDGAVPACSQPGKLVEWVQQQGIVLNSAAKAEVTELLAADDLPANVRKALEVRQEAAKTSVSKLQAMLNRSSPDGRVRGGFMYHGASTGRWISTGVNLANLPRPRKVYEDAKLRTDTLFQAFRTEDPDVLRYLYDGDLGRPLHLISDAIRGFIWAAPGHDLVQADYSNIEGNVVAWLAGEDWKLDAIRELIADPSLPDMYRRTAAAILGLPVEEVTKKHWARQAVGKPAELGLSYGGGVMAFVTFARGYGVNLEGLAPAILAQADEARLEKAAKRYEGEMKRGRSGTAILSKDAWIACEVVKLGWRAANSAIARSWRDLETAVREAVQNPGSITEAAKTRYRVAQGFLWAQLPSGRCLAYGSPRLKDQVWAKVRLDDGTWVDSEVMDRDAAEAGERRGTVKIEGVTNAKVTVLGVNAVTKKWERYALYGGIICENCLSAVTEVLTLSGWKQITDILPTDKLWDGIEWVDHGGVVSKGSAMTINTAGVWATPDHKFWTDDGWKRAEDADADAVEAASPSPEFDRAALRSAARYGLRGWGWQKELVVGPVRLRHNEVVRRFGTAQGSRQELRLPGTRIGQRACNDAWNVTARGLRGLEQHDRSLRTAVARGLRALRWARDNGLRALASVSELLGGYGPDVAQGAHAGAIGQQRGLFAGKLRLAGPPGAGAQQADERLHRHAKRPADDMRGRRDQRHQLDDAGLPSGRGVAGGAYVRRAGQQPEGNVEPVYDILNAGPRHRFTVRGSMGPIIVSNCTQAVARDILVNGMLKADEAGYEIIAHVYDEILTEVPKGFGSVAEFERLICELPAWAAGLPLTASGWRGKRYRKD